LTATRNELKKLEVFVGGWRGTKLGNYLIVSPACEQRISVSVAGDRFGIFFLESTNF